MEEVGLKVKNLRFYKSQPWSFSDSLLMGFFCEVDGSDEIRIDHSEPVSYTHLDVYKRQPPDCTQTGSLERQFWRQQP